MNDVNPHAGPAQSSVSPSPLFWLNLLLAAILATLVLIAPLIVSAGSPRILSLFAHDATLRQTALATAIGLTVTAFVFFRSRSGEATSSAKPPRMPPTNVVGA